MILSKEKYYNRRWFLTILFLCASSLVIYVGINVLIYNKGKQELNLSTVVPIRLSVKYSNKGDFKIIQITEGETRSQSSTVIENQELDKLTKMLENTNLQIPNKEVFSLVNSDLDDLDFKHWYWKGRLYELRVNEHTIIPFKQESQTLGYLVIGFGLSGLLFQVWTISVLIRKRKTIYEDSLKKNKV